MKAVIEERPTEDGGGHDITFTNEGWDQYHWRRTLEAAGRCAHDLITKAAAKAGIYSGREWRAAL